MVSIIFLIDEGKGNMVEIGVTGENVGFSQGLGPLSGFHVEQEAFPFLKDLFLQYVAVSGGLAKGHQQCAAACQ